MSFKRLVVRGVKAVGRAIGEREIGLYAAAFHVAGKGHDRLAVARLAGVVAAFAGCGAFTGGNGFHRRVLIMHLAAVMGGSGRFVMMVDLFDGGCVVMMAVFLRHRGYGRNGAQ